MLFRRLQMRLMKKETSLPVRLDANDKKRLRGIADAMGMTVSALIRILVKSFIDEYDRSNGKIVMPPQWASNGDIRKSPKRINGKTPS